MYKKEIEKELGFCEYKHVDIYLQDRLNVKKLVQNLLQDKGAIDIIDLFDNKYMKAYRFMTQIFSSKDTITNNQYDKCMRIIHKFEN